MQSVVRRVVFVLLVLVIPSTALASATGPSLKLVASARAYQGKPYTVSAAANGASCALTVRYADGAKQAGLLGAKEANGRVTWKWTLPQVTAPGPALLTARCGGSKGSRKITVVGSLIPPKIVVTKSGWSVRERPYAGSSVSYGVVLRNTSPNVNAMNVNVQVNFVLADSKLIGTATKQIPSIGAHETYNYADQLAFPGAAPIAKLELVILVGAREKAQRTPRPGLDNIAVVPGQFEPAWAGWVQGEVVNDHPKLMLRSASLSAVLFDAAGHVLGGATGAAYNPLPPGTRQVFKLTSGIDAIPYSKVASVAISATPSWETNAP
jgi:hypothetical protein